MKIKFALVFVVSLLISCSKNVVYNDSSTFLSNKDFLLDLKDDTKSTREILEKYSPSILAHIKADTSLFYYGNNVIEDDSLSRQMIICGYLKGHPVIATEVNIKDTLINFYHLNEGVWELIGTEKTNSDIYQIQFQDLNGDGHDEIVTYTSRNMNANTFQKVYFYSDKANTIKYAGFFSTDFKIIESKKQIQVNYEGSSYMDTWKTLYEWRKEKLVPIKQVVIAHNMDTDNVTTFEIYENLSDSIDGLKLKFKEPYDNDSKKQKQLWSNFFKE